MQNERIFASWAVERTLSYARWAGAALAFVQAALYDPAPPSRPYVTAATVALGVVLVAANVVLFPALRGRRVTFRLARLMFMIDFGVVIAITWLYLTGPNATQWVLFMIVQLEAAYRWGLRGALGTAGVAASFYAAARASAAAEFGFALTIDSLTYVTGLVGVQAVVVGSMATRLRAERDTSEQLHVAALALGARLDRRSVVHAVVREARRLTGAVLAVVWVPAEDGFRAAAVDGVEWTDELGILPAAHPLFGETTPAKVRRTGCGRTSGPLTSSTRGLRPHAHVTTPDDRADPDVPVAERLHVPGDWQAVAAVPLREDAVLACYFRTTGKTRPREEQLPALEALGALASLAVDNASAYERERSALQRMKALDTLKDDFLATVSHELRTPLTVVEGFATTLTDRWDDLAEDRRRDLVGRIESHARELHERIGDLLDFARLQSGSFDMRPEVFDLDSFVRETVNRLEPTLGSRHIEVASTPGCTAWADEGATGQIVENLVTNAVRYSPPDTTIRLDVNSDAAWVEVSVTDEGIGVPENERERIFQRFYRGQSDDVRRTRGTGIGLALVKELTEAMGGTVTLQSTVGNGSTFTVRLPAAEPVVPAVLPDGDLVPMSA